MSKEISNDEAQTRFLNDVQQRVNYCLNESRKPSTREKLELLAFSILSMIDGCSGHPACLVIPCPHETDKAYHLKEGTDYYPMAAMENNIAGNLHGQYAQKFMTK